MSRIDSPDSPSVPSRLRAGDAHLWCCDIREATEPGLLRRCEQLLDQTELRRLRRFRARHAARSFLLAHAMLRDVLSRYGGRPAAEWRFEMAEHGKPDLVASQRYELPAFNLSHSENLILLAFSPRPCRVGVDVEFHRPDRRFGQLAERKFSTLECAQLRRCEAGNAASRFYDLWALKESFIKARGEGLTLGLQRFAFEFAPDALSFRFLPDADLGEDPRQWTFRAMRIAGVYSAALAVQRPAGVDAERLLCWRGIPFSEAREWQPGPGLRCGRITDI